MLKRYFAPCVDGFGRVPISPKLEMLVKSLKKGDSILTPFGSATIKCVLKSKVHQGFLEMTEFNKMLIIPNHPIQIYGEWTLPKEVKEIKFLQCQSLYSFILDKHHIMTINGNNIITPGYAFNKDSNKSLSETQKFIDELMCHPGWKNGLIEITK